LHNAGQPCRICRLGDVAGLHDDAGDNRQVVVMSEMSKDRVEFTLMGNGRDEQPTIRAAARAFGLQLNDACKLVKANCGTGTRMRCRPSQFARFIVYRVEEGLAVNQVKALSPKLVPDVPSMVDVSMNPAR
jgi:hypothetical protein